MRLVLLALCMILAGAAVRAEEAVDIAARLGRGINVLGYDPIWRDPARARFQPRHFTRIREGGFRHVRMNLQAFAHMDADNRLDPRWLATLDRMVAAARAAGLMVILDEHDYRPCGQDAALCATKLLAFWGQVAPRFRDAPDGVLFEILNEPNRQLDAAAWNRLLAEALAVIRASNPHRTVVIGPANSNSFHALDTLALPEDDRAILVTVHYYDPFRFTHQGASWTTPSRVGDIGYSWGTAEERAAVARDFDRIAAWGQAHRRPILLGEFGAYEKGAMEFRAAWTASVARAAEAHGIPWSYWQFESSFDAFDMARDNWIAPIHDALVPPP